MSNLERHFSNGAETLSHRWTTHTDGDSIPTTAWSANEKMLAAASEQGDIWFFSPDSRQPILSQHSAHEPGICSLSWHPRHPLMASSGQDGRVKIWLEGKAFDQVETSDAWVEKVIWSPDGRWLAAAAGREVYLWELQITERQLKPHFVSHEHADLLTDIAWRPWMLAIPNPPEIAASSRGQISFWQPNTYDPTRLLTSQGNFLSVAWSPDGRYLASGEQSAKLHLWALPSERETVVCAPADNISQLIWDARSQTLACSGGNDVVIWNASNPGSKPEQLVAHERSVTALAAQNDGPLLASGGQDGLLAVWNPSAGRDALCFDYYPNGEIHSLSWSTADRYLVSGTADGRITLYDNPRTKT